MEESKISYGYTVASILFYYVNLSVEDISQTTTYFNWNENFLKPV